ncbi:MAG TPA: protein phosphatase 2C domain-containing protein [Candidatus Polarisedimenticolia bacterium]|jgi:serine/threonine protein phosphatase PrpC|nr:protein phosphatase 2C domain-containing protein [Candidatus Polarisedimenticolia bacterium]
MDVEFAQLSDRGKVREGNEDYLGYVQPASPAEVRARGWLFALADGVGGHDFGEVASHTAVESVLAGFREAAPGEPHTILLPNLMQAANARVVEMGRAASPTGPAMATTMVACTLRHDRVVVAHVGDSRCYLIRRGGARLLTRDHTVANEQVRLGLMSSQEAADSATRHMLSRSLGSALSVNVEVNEHLVLAGDVLVLCSDGLHGAVTASELAAITSAADDLETAAHSLVDIANQRDGSDNISLQVVRVRAVERVGMYRGRPYRLP